MRIYSCVSLINKLIEKSITCTAVAVGAGGSRSWGGGESYGPVCVGVFCDELIHK